MTLQFQPVEVNDTGEMVPLLPEHTWIGQCKAEFGTTANGDTKIVVTWTVLEDPTGEYEEKIGTEIQSHIVVRPSGHKYERMFLQDMYAMADKYGLERFRGWDGLVAFVAELDGLKGEFDTFVDKKGDSRVSYRTKLKAASDDSDSDEKPAQTKKATPAAKKGAKKK